MYKIIFVDDERFALNNLAQAIDWGKFGFEIAGFFVNAKAAIDFIKENRVDAIISDIKMPGMSGVEFAKFIYENYPNIAFVLLSGYGNFDYAKEAIKYKVVAYLLKPITLSEISEVIEKIRKNLAKKDYGNKSLSEAGLELQEFITNYISKKTNDISVLKKTLKSCGIKNDITNVPVVFINIKLINVKEYLRNIWGYGRESLNNAVNNLLLNEDAVAIPTSYYFDSIDYVVFLDCENIESCRNQMKLVKENVIKNAREIFNLPLVVEEKKIARNIYDIFDDVRDEFIGINVSMIYELISKSEKEKALEQFQSFLEKIKKSTEDIQKFAQLLCERLCGSKNYYYYSAQLKSAVSEIKSGRKTLTNEMIEQLIADAADENSSLNMYDYITMAKRYINKSYAQNITLQDVAKQVSLSVSWFSKMFKKETGMNFVDYLNEVRINKAIELLKTTNHSVNEIYEMVGYKSRNHFYTLFKRYTGYSAQEYRRVIKSGEQKQ